jgi:hypothetical protein
MEKKKVRARRKLYHWVWEEPKGGFTWRDELALKRDGTIHF